MSEEKIGSVTVSAIERNEECDCYQVWVGINENGVCYPVHAQYKPALAFLISAFHLLESKEAENAKLLEWKKGMKGIEEFYAMRHERDELKSQNAKLVEAVEKLDAHWKIVFPGGTVFPYMSASVGLMENIRKIIKAHRQSQNVSNEEKQE